MGLLWIDWFQRNYLLGSIVNINNKQDGNKQVMSNTQTYIVHRSSIIPKLKWSRKRRQKQKGWIQRISSLDFQFLCPGLPPPHHQPSTTESMSGFLIQELQSIANDHRLTHRDQEHRIIDKIHREHGSTLSFLTAISSLSNEHYYQVLNLLKRYLDAFDRILLCPQLIQFLDLIQSRQSTPIVNVLLEMLTWDVKKNLSHVTVDYASNLDGMMAFAISCLGSDDLEVAEKAGDLISLVIPAHPAYVKAMYLASNQFPASVAHSRTVLLRYHSLLAELVKASEPLLQVVEEVGFVDQLLLLVRAEDVLVQVNAIELLVSIAGTDKGLEALNRHGGVQWLIATACQGADPLIKDEALRCLSALFSRAAAHSMLFIQQIDPSAVSLFMETIFQYIDEGNEHNKIAGLGLLSDFMAISAYSLAQALSYRNGDLLQAWLRLLIASKPELQGAALHSIARVLEQPDEQYVENDRALPSKAALTGIPESTVEDTEVTVETVSNLKKHLFAAMNAFKRNTAVEYLIYSAKQPISATRHAAVEIMTALAMQAGGWGLQLLFGRASSETALLQSAFWQYLTNRLSESNKEGKDFKFALIQAVSHNPLAEHFPAEIKRRLHQMINQGAYYMPPAMEDMQTL